eukprot:CAMPEP_0197664702 /NCGR_PEP_ID=MMETSP1338-20131121/58801_1 /TAXON_ID=43686 ORGANISM="Pelagodinium beii, Strain RCC1491" /NCGR_SAMPLE_ID=MMETSP1338 /ASSEMBLY_ACC=CAM_ASM_000754 /LENGTH=206 /DNA_ID=CAMNT_0043243397 /DNA_START=16 /DNA_END=633 /DNA_ORIENTATION=+
MPHIGVIFEIRQCESRPGETVSIVGASRELGNWDPFDYKAAASLELRTSDAQYPCWAMSAPVWIELSQGHQVYSDFAESWGEITPEDSEARTPTSTLHDSPKKADEEQPEDSFVQVQVEYKYLKDRRKLHDFPSILWEDHIANRRITLPAEYGSIWLISDGRFNESSEPTITRTSLAEVLQRRGSLDPEWTSRHQAGARASESPEW